MCIYVIVSVCVAGVVEVFGVCVSVCVIIRREAKIVVNTKVFVSK